MKKSKSATASKRLIRIGSRKSPLALKQISEVHEQLQKCGCDLQYELRVFDNSGDRDKLTPLDQVKDDYFTDRIDQALLAGDVDVAIHSAKDLPDQLPSGMKIVALTAGEDPSDALVGATSLEELPSEAKIGTSSVLRQTQVLRLRPDLTIVHIRGTIEERLALLDRGDCDAIIVATAALKRLGFHDRIDGVLPWESTPLQGQLAVVSRSDDDELAKIFALCDVRSKYGRVTFVSSHNSDPDLITVKGLKTIQAADVIFYEANIHPDLLRLMSNETEWIKVVGCDVADSKWSEQCLVIKKQLSNSAQVVYLSAQDMSEDRALKTLRFFQGYHMDAEMIRGVSQSMTLADIPGERCRRWLYTGTHYEDYQFLGQVTNWPMIDIQPRKWTAEQCDLFMNDIGSAQGIILTSPHAVKIFVNWSKDHQLWSAIKDKPVALLGQRSVQTAEALGLPYQLVAQVATGPGLFQALLDARWHEMERIVFPRSSQPNSFLLNALRVKGVDVKEWSIYDALEPSYRDLPNHPINGVIFTSPSGVRHFLKAYQSIPKTWMIVVRGSLTAKALHDAGYPHTVVLEQVMKGERFIDGNRFVDNNIND